MRMGETGVDDMGQHPPGGSTRSRLPAAMPWVVWAALLGVLAVILLFMVLPTCLFHGPRPGAMKAVCLSSIKNIALALRMYLDDNHGRFPKTGQWCDTVAEYVRSAEVYRCPSAAEQGCGYAYNAALDDRPAGDLSEPPDTVAVFEGDAGWSASGGPELLPREPRHLGGDTYAFADGHAAWLGRQWRGPEESRIWEKRPVAEVRWGPE